MLREYLDLLARAAVPVEFERPVLAARAAGAPAAELAELEEVKLAALRVRALLERRLDAVRADAHDMLTAAAPADGFPLLWAPRGLQDEDHGMYSAADVAGMDASLVPDVNHYTLLLGGGAARVAEGILALK
jgi:hypothetical protein